MELLIARNPDPDGALPYLLHVPVEEPGLVFRTKGTWPRTSALYCHPVPDAEWPDHPEIVERVPLTTCRRRGAAIDVIADRGRENRSQIVFTRGRGVGLGREPVGGRGESPGEHDRCVAARKARVMTTASRPSPDSPSDAPGPGSPTPSTPTPGCAHAGLAGCGDGEPARRAGFDPFAPERAAGEAVTVPQALPPPGAPAGSGSRGGDGEADPASAAALSSARLLRPVRRAPRSGWRR